MATKTATKKTVAKKQAARTGGSKPATPKKVVDSKPTEPRTPLRNESTPKQPDDGNEIVVFAFRLTRAERDAIHAATGPAQASKFVRSLALAAVRADAKALKECIEAVQQTG